MSITDDDVPADWSLIPPGLGAGAEFRLLFVTSGSRNGQSMDIADYNTFVQNAAGGGHTRHPVPPQPLPGLGQHADGGRPGQHRNHPHGR